MARAKRPSSDSNRAGMDYYEYKRQHDMVRMRQRAVNITGDVELPVDRQSAEADPAPKKRGRSAAEPVRVAQDGAAEALAQPEQAIRQASPVQAQPEVAAEPLADAADAVDAAVDDAVDAANADVDVLSEDAPDADDFDENELEITNPFAGTLTRLRRIGGHIKGGASALKQRLARPERDDDDDDDDDDDVPSARKAAAAAPSLTLALSSADDQGSSRRERRAAATQGGAGDLPQAEDDPLGVMRPADEQTHRAFMRPEGEEAKAQVAASAGEMIAAMDTREGNDMSDNDVKRPELTEKLMDELGGVPALSRRERKAMAGAGTLAKAADKPDPDEDATGAQEDVAAPSDEPTQKFKPLRARAVQAAPQDDTDDGEDEEDDDDDDFEPERPRFGARFGIKKRHRVYRDEDLDEDEDDEDAEYEDDYQDDYDDDEEYDEGDYDDYDEEEALEQEYPVSFGRRVLGFLKGILIVVLIFLVVILALRQMEASGLFSLDWVRSTIGQILPIEALLPAPNAQPSAAPEDEQAPPDEQVPEDAEAPLESEDDLPLDDPQDEPEDEWSEDELELEDPGAEGSPLDEQDSTEEITPASGASV